MLPLLLVIVNAHRGFEKAQNWEVVVCNKTKPLQRLKRQSQMQCTAHKWKRRKMNAFVA